MLSPGYGILFATLGGTMLLRNKAKRRWLNLLERDILRSIRFRVAGETEA
jgi:hypothetical protein